jgi:hypothetical protein
MTTAAGGPVFVGGFIAKHPTAKDDMIPLNIRSTPFIELPRFP